MEYKISYAEDTVYTTVKTVILPLYDTAVLDIGLDSGKVSFLSAEKHDIRPFYRVKIEISDGETTKVLSRSAADTGIYQVSFGDKVYYKHIINTIEYTKILERVPIDTLTFTNYLSRSSLPSQQEIEPTITRLDGSDYEIIDVAASVQNLPRIIEYYFKGSTVAIPFGFSHNKDLAGGGTVAILFDESYIEVNGEKEYFTADKMNTDKVITFSELGEYNIKIVIRKKYTYTSGGPIDIWYDGYSFEYNGITAVEFTVAPSNIKNITECINRVLSAGATRLKGSRQRFALNAAQAAEFSQINAPEFFLPKMTMFEALLTIGGYIHAIPRLEIPTAENTEGLTGFYEGIVFFDKLGGNKTFTLPENWRGFEQHYAADQHVSALDSTVENFVNTKEKNGGTIVDPFPNGFKSVRAAEGVKISADNCIIEAGYKIYQLYSLLVNFRGTTYNITPYCYEAAEYELLTSYDKDVAAYPNSKAYALRWTQGSNIIDGLTFIASTALSVAQPWRNRAIENIIKEVSGQNIAASEYKDLKFQIIYKPMPTARIVQKKAYMGYTGLENNGIYYNQGANSVESELFGENQLGAVARLGEGLTVITTRFKRLADLPAVGDLETTFGYVATVATEYQPRGIKATITFAPNFNRIAEYLSINSNLRLYAISEKQAFDRYVNYGMDIIIGDEIPERGLPFTTGIKNAFMQSLDGTATYDKQLSVVVAEGYNKNDLLINRTAHSVIGEAIGNSLVFAFGFEDNFSAGKQASGAAYGEVIPEQYVNVQKSVSYVDNYGEMYYLNIKGYNALDNYTAEAWPAVGEQGGEKLLDFTDSPLIVDKDNREIINVSIQLHARANRKSIVIGRALTKYNPLVANRGKIARIYFLPARLNMLNSRVDLTGATQGDKATIYDTGSQFYIGGVTVPVDCKAWVLATTDGEYFIGENKDYTAGETTERIFFNF